MLRSIVEDEGFKVTVVADADGARKVLDDHWIVLIISDASLGEGTALTVAEEALKRNKPPIVMTGSVERQREWRETGIDFMPKPFKLAELHRRIDELIGRNAAEDRHANGEHS